MAQVQNLLDLFQKNRRDAQGPAADGKLPVKAAPGSGKSSRSGGDLLPPGADPKGNSGVSPSPSSFHEKIEKSKSKLAAKGRSQSASDAAQRHAASARPNASRSKSDAADSRNDDTRPAQAGKASHAERNERPDRDNRAGMRRGDGGERNQDRKTETDAPDARPSSIPDASQAKTVPTGREDAGTGLDQADADAIKAGLDKLGIQVEDGQLEDPAFLMEILRLLQAMPTQAAPGEEAGTRPQADLVVGAEAAQAEGAQSVEPGLETMPDAPVQAQSQADQPSDDAAAEAKTEAPKSLTRKELARLVESRIGGLQRAAEAETPAHSARAAQSPAVTPREWQGVQARSHSEGPSPEPLPMADLDRLRVLQAAAAQSAAPKDQAAGTQTDFALESDSIEPEATVSASHPAASGTAASGTSDQDAQADANGRNGDNASGAGAVASKEGGQSAKGADAGPQFHHVLDQARATEHKPATAADAGFRPQAHGAAILEQIARKLTAGARKPGDEISIQLSPDHLGKVRVSLEMKEEGMSARIAVENDSVRKQVESNLASLKDALKDQGIQLQGLEVSVDQRHSSLFNPDGSNAESFFHRQGRGEDRGGNARNDEPATLDIAPETDTGRRWGYNTMEYIG